MLLRCAMLCCVLAVLRYVLHTVLCCAVLVALCCAVLCCAVLCCAASALCAGSSASCGRPCPALRFTVSAALRNQRLSQRDVHAE